MPDFWTLWLILVHIAAFIGLILSAWVTGVCVRKAGEAPKQDEGEILAAETTIYAPPSYGLSMNPRGRRK